MTNQLAAHYKERPRSSEVEAAAILEGFSILQARILAGRITRLSGTVRDLVLPRLNHLDSPELLPDIGLATELLANAVQNKQPIAIVTDHDADGSTSHAIIRLSLKAWGVSSDLVSGFLSHRMTEGYGISDAFVDRLLPQLKSETCIVTADQGSTDEARISRLRAAGHKVIVTDHHGVPDSGPPLSAHAVVNPVRLDSHFPDQSIAGCHTALLVMAATRAELVKRGVIPEKTPKVSALLDYSAVGTVADASSLGQSTNNRLIVQKGLHLMNSRPRPCWNAIRRLLNKEGDWVASDIGFQIATRINARGRLGDAMLGVQFLCAEDDETAFVLAQELDANNLQRRTIEKALTLHAITVATQEICAGRNGLCLWLGNDSHAGVHGITATRIVEKFGRPTICLSPVNGNDDVVTGSIRTTEKVNVREALTAIQTRFPTLLMSSGGHKGAGGLKIQRSNISLLQNAWDSYVTEIYGGITPKPLIFTDGDIDSPTLTQAKELSGLEPYGRGFEAPLFAGNWLVKEVRHIGDGTHLKLKLSRGGELAEAVWFGATAKDAQPPVTVGQIARFAFTLDVQTFRNVTRLQLLIRGIDAG